MFDQIVAWFTIVALLVITVIVYSCVRVGSKSEAYAFGAPIKRVNEPTLSGITIPVQILNVDCEAYITYVKFPSYVLIQRIEYQSPRKPVVNQLEIRLKDYLNSRNYV